MIHAENVRISFRKFQGSPRSAEKIARQAMQRLERISAEVSSRRTIDRVDCAPLRIPAAGLSDEAISELVAEHAWRSIQGRI